MSVVHIEDLHYGLRRHFWSPYKAILRGVSLTVEAGEIFGFLGPNGAGKTTTIKTLLGLLEPERGKTLLFGKSAAVAETRRRIGFMPERAYFPEHLTPRELLRLHGILAGMSLAQADAAIDGVLEQVGMRSAAR